MNKWTQAQDSKVLKFINMIQGYQAQVPPGKRNYNKNNHKLILESLPIDKQ